MSEALVELLQVVTIRLSVIDTVSLPGNPGHEARLAVGMFECYQSRGLAIGTL